MVKFGKKIRIALFLIFLREFRFDSDLVNINLRNVPFKKSVNYVKVGFNVALKTPLFRGFPIRLKVEPFFGCNLSCPKCPSHRRNGKRKSESLSLSTYKKFIDETGSHALELSLWAWGEPFLNKNLPEMIKYAKDKKIIVKTSTNGNLLLDDEFNRRILLSGLDHLIIGLDGTTEKSYLTYRKGGDFIKVIEGIRSIVKLKKQLKVKKPIINLRMVVTRYNEQEIPLMKELAEELDVDILTIKSVNPSFDGSHANEKLIPKNKRYHRYAYYPGTLKRIEKDEYFCHVPWSATTLFSDGTIVPCEYDLDSDFSFGNMRDESFKDIWFDEKAQQVRHAFKNKNPPTFCQKCPYKDLIVDSCNIEVIELAGKP